MVKDEILSKSSKKQQAFADSLSGEGFLVTFSFQLIKKSAVDVNSSTALSMTRTGFEPVLPP